ncbi:type II toxin-antitoxin system HicB family antitoxin [Hutsoniella sourekii]|uniref:type II toxin-antitoxin system HicB family antitoxin n=1 Tax=Hutsoniella sourekii TaxID=87650 RepID=UPI000480F83D|nr:type II toxin-antitoxin system HicB family antitoxin [Hutsoniella sourekii]
MIVYPAIIDQDGNYFSVFFPDVDGALTQGETLEEAYEMAGEALGTILEDYTNYPEATAYDVLIKEYPNSIVTLVGFDHIAFKKKYQSKTVRKNVTIPEWLNDLATSNNINFSQTLTEALEAKLGV